MIPQFWTRTLRFIPEGHITSPRGSGFETHLPAVSGPMATRGRRRISARCPVAQAGRAGGQDSHL